MYAPHDDWDEFLLMLEVHEQKKFWEPRNDGEHFKLCKILQFTTHPI
jgi:hypothetical protein